MNKEDFVKETTFEFKQGIINYCRKMDKLDVYEWIAEDELKIIQLQQENQQLKEDIKGYEQERQKIYNSIPFKENKQLKEENEKLKQWDNNKDTRNSRQRVANAKLHEENQR